MGRISRSWDLLGQSFAVLKSDKQLMWLPVVSAVFSIAAMVIVFASGILVLVPVGAIPHDPGQQKLLSQEMTPFIFLFYLASYSIVTFFNVALVSIAANRLAGGSATLNDGLEVAWKRKWRIFQRALLAATVGMFLKMLERNMKFLGRIIMGAIGFVWALASFFVAPLLAAEDMGPVEALYESANLIRDTWGEEIVGGFSFGFIFFLLMLPGLILPVFGARFGQTGLFAGLAVMTIYWLVLGVVNSAAQGIFVAALYRYATTKEVSAGFSRDDLSGAWLPKGGSSD